LLIRLVEGEGDAARRRLHIKGACRAPTNPAAGLRQAGVKYEQQQWLIDRFSRILPGACVLECLLHVLFARSLAGR